MTAVPTRYLDTDADVNGFLTELSGVRAIALDTEGASFHRFVDRIYLLQLSTAAHEAIIDPLPIRAPEQLGSLLADPTVEVVLHDADYDLRLLHQDYGWTVTHLFDTRVAAQLLGIRSFGLAALLEQFFGVRLDKKHQRADWSMRPLTPDMLAYAAQDTRHLLGLRDELRRQLEQKGRWAWAQEEFTRAEAARWEPEEAGQGFLRLKGARDLTRRELARLRELVQWRDAIAAELDRATFRVAGNELLLDLAKRAPATREALVGMKGFPRGMSEARVQEALQGIARADAEPESALPRFPRAPRWDKPADFDDLVGRLRALRDAVATELDLDPGVLCSRERLEAVVRRRPTAVEELAEIPGFRRWQIGLLGDPFLRAMHKPSKQPA